MENLVVNTKKKVTLEKFSSSVKVSAQSEIKKILDISVRSVISSAEQSNNVVSLSGKMIVNVIYQSVENEIASAESTVDFIEKQQLVTRLSDMVATDDASVFVETYSGGEILCSVMHSVQIFGIYNYEVADFVGENTAFVLNKKSLVLNKLIAVKGEDFVVAEETESNIQNMRVLNSVAKVLSYEVISAVDKIVIDGKLAVETVNKLLIPAGVDNFSTLDACVIDLDKNECVFIKLGSSVSVLKHEKTSELIASDSLPIGIVKNIKPTIVKKQIFQGDMIFLSSDGVVDSFSSVQSFQTFVNDSKIYNMQKFLDNVLFDAESMNQRHIDDMTIIGVNLLKN